MDDTRRPGPACRRGSRARRRWLETFAVGSVAVVLATLTVRGDARPADGSGDLRPLQAVATTSVLADLVRQVAGERWAVTVLVGGGDPHGFEPSAADVRVLSQAELVFLSGSDLESTGLRRVVEAVVAPGRRVQLAGEGEVVGDPHFWLSVPAALQAVGRIRQALTRVDPDGAGEYLRRARAYGAELEELDRWVRRQVERVEPARRLLVSDHGLLGHFAGEYGLTVVGTVLPSGHTLAEPSAAEAGRLVAAMRRLRVAALFVEASAPSLLARRLAAEAGVPVVELYVEALGPEGSGAETYVGAMRTNVSRIVRALAPADVPSSPAAEAGGP